MTAVGRYVEIHITAIGLNRFAVVREFGPASSRRQRIFGVPVLLIFLAKMEWLHVQRFHLVKEPIHDTASSTHARGHADPQLFREYSGLLPAASLALCTPLPAIPRRPRSGQHSNLPSLSNEREEACTQLDQHRHLGAALPVYRDAVAARCLTRRDRRVARSSQP